MARERPTTGKAALAARAERHAPARALAETPTQCTSRAMTPAALALLLELHHSAEPVRCNTSPARVAAWSDFKREGLLRQDAPLLAQPNSLTEKGLAHTMALCSLPLPVARTSWVTPGRDE